MRLEVSLLVLISSLIKPFIMLFYISFNNSSFGRNTERICEACGNYVVVCRQIRRMQPSTNTQAVRPSTNCIKNIQAFNWNAMLRVIHCYFRFPSHRFSQMICSRSTSHKCTLKAFSARSSTDRHGWHLPFIEMSIEMYRNRKLEKTLAPLLK